MNNNLKEACIEIIMASFDMSDTYFELALDVSTFVGYDFDEYEDDEWEVFEECISIMVDDKSKGLANYLLPYVEDDIAIENLLEYIGNEEWDLVSSINTIYNDIKSYPNGEKVRKAVEKNIYNSSSFDGYFESKKANGDKLYLSEV